MKKIMKRIISVICVAALFIACNEALRYILIDDTESYTRVSMHQLYNSEENIEIAFVGSSHVYRSFVPEITDAGFGAYTFNCGSSSQKMDGSLVMVKELLDHHDVSHIYLELFHEMAESKANKDRDQMTATYIISDYMKPSVRRIHYILQASTKEHWVNGFILARRNWEKIFDLDYVKTLIAKKNTQAYKNYELIREEGQSEYYVDRGYVACEGILANELNQRAYTPINLDAVSDNWKNALQDIIKVCKKEGVELTFFITPMPECTTVGKGNYDEYHTFIQKIADEAGVDFYDFNLINNQIFSTKENTWFKDVHHLNADGAEEFSRLFCEIFTGKLDKEEVLYDSLAQKLENEEPYVYGAGYLREEDEDKTVKNVRIVANRTEGIEYMLIANPKEGESYILQDFSQNREITFPKEEEGVLSIVWRLKEKPDKVTTIEVEY